MRSKPTACAAILCVLPGLWAGAAPLPDSVLPCTPCHDRENGAQIEEWLASPYSEPEGGLRCTDCHRRRCSGTGDAHARVDDLTTVRSRQLGQAVRLAVAAVCSERSVSVEVAVSNIGVGHLLPTSRQGRALILEVLARDADRTSFSARSAAFRARLPPFATDVSRYRFHSPGAGPVSVVARLVWVPATGPRLQITRAETACEAPRALMAGVVLQPTQAPEWEISAWLNDDPGPLREQRGRVVLVGFFQLWCPGCNEFSIPLFRRWSELYGDRGDVLLVSVHSVFEGHEYQSLERLQRFIRENGIIHPVGIDTYDDTADDVSLTMRRYQVGGTPHLAIVDKEGMLRFEHFGIFDPKPVERFIERLLDEPPRAVARKSELAPLAERYVPEFDRDLSGSYVFRTDPATGVCATWSSRMEVPAELRIYRDAIDIEFAQSFFGVGQLGVRYDARTGRVEGASESALAGGGINSQRGLRLEGVLDRQADPPELVFEISFLGGKCGVHGRAHLEP